jgi:hypothetical protein
MMERFPGTLEALSPIHHGGDEKTGSTPILRSLTHWDPDASAHVRLPVIAGNAIRGFLRRLLMKDLLKHAGYEVTAKGLHYFFMSGGVLESTDETTAKTDLAFRRWIRDALPPVALLGGSIGNQIMDGCLQVDFAVPVCREYRAYLREDLRQDPRAAQAVRTFTDVTFQTRRDDLRAERAEDEQATQMKVDFECLIPGTLFQHEFRLVAANAMDRACFAHAVALWSERGTLAAKAAQGYGRVRMTYVGIPDPAPYRAYLEAAEEVRAALQRLEGEFR